MRSGRGRHAISIAVVGIALSASSCGRIGYDPRTPPGFPSLVSTVIDDGAVSTGTPVLRVTVVARGETATLSVRVALAASDGDCQSQYADDGFEPYADPSTTRDVFVLPVDGTEKVCAWVRDEMGRTSVIDPSGGIPGVDSDTIEFAGQNPPVVTDLNVVNTATGATSHAVGDPLTISFRITDVEGLADDPVALYYTTEPASEEAWTLITGAFGGLGGSPTEYDGRYLDFAAPTADAFRIKLVARDAAGNSSLPALSDVQNGGAFRVWAGSPDRGLGGTGRSTTIRTDSPTSQKFAIDPATHDVYLVDQDFGIIRYDARAGTTERFMRENDTTNLPDDGVLPADPVLGDVWSVRFGPDGLLYVGGTFEDTELQTSGVFYQIDLATRRCRRYLGAGDAFDGSATPGTVFVVPSMGSFDEDGTFYFLTSCTPGTWSTSGATVRLMRATQGSDGAAETLSVVAGDCTRGDPPTGPVDPTTVPLADSNYPSIGTITVWDRGARIYVGMYGTPTIKIIDGQLYSSNVVVSAAGSITYDPKTDTLYAADGSITAYRPNTAGNDGDVELAVVVDDEGTGRCADDGYPAAAACANAHYAMWVDEHGTLFFMDGPGINDFRPFRVRFVDPEGALRTYVGAPPFHRAGVHRRVLRASFAGIHYKHATDPNQAAFPAGLYFLDYQGLVLGHIDPATDLTVVDWGNESGATQTLESGLAIGPDVGVGRAYEGGNLRPLGFDDQGLPWLRYGPRASVSWLVRVDTERRVVALQQGSTDWENADEGDDPFDFEIWPYGLVSNLTLKGDVAFFLGGYTSSSPVASIKAFDFAAGMVRHVMGSSSDGVSPDSTVPGSVRGASLSSECHDNDHWCFSRYRADEDRLYFSEGQRLRYVTSPSDPAASTLGTLFVQPDGRRVTNFSFRPDGSQVFYLTDDRLHCHELTGARAWCDDSPLGPGPIFGRIERGEDQLTWLDDATLLISTYGGEILAYDLPP